MKALIELTTTEGQIVLDPFAGSGTTVIAADELGRIGIGYEADKQYAEVAQKRLANNSQKGKLL
jgi:DNA modification methylase